MTEADDNLPKAEEYLDNTLKAKGCPVELINEILGVKTRIEGLRQYIQKH